MDLSQQLAILRPRLRLIVLVTIIAGILSFALGSLIPKTYEAQATLLVGQAYGTSQASQPPQINYDSFLASEQLATTLAQLVDTRPFLAKVTASLGLTDDLTAMRSRVDAQAPPASLFITISARAASDKGAADLANAVASELLAEAPTVLVNGGSPRPDGVVTIVDPAVASEAVKSPKVPLYAALGALTALIVAVATIFILAYRESPQARRGPAARRVSAPETLPADEPAAGSRPAMPLAPIAPGPRLATSPGERPAPLPDQPAGPLLLTEVRRPAPVVIAPPATLPEPGPTSPTPANVRFRAHDGTLLRPRPAPTPAPARASASSVPPAAAPQPSAEPAPAVTASTASVPALVVAAATLRPAATPARKKAAAPATPPAVKRESAIKAKPPASTPPPADPAPAPKPAAANRPAPGNDPKSRTRARAVLEQRPSSD